MLGGVAIGRVVATADVTARLAEPQMNPTAADLKAILATVGARRHLNDLTDVLTIFHMNCE